MSDSVKPPMHGRDHRPGGSDPIPGLGVTIPWIRLRQLSLAQDLTSGNVVIVYDDRINNYTDYFDVIQYTGHDARIVPKVAGLYQVTVRLDFDFLTYPFVNPIELMISGIDQDNTVTQYSDYSTPVMGWSSAIAAGTWPGKTPYNSSGFAYAEATFRGGPKYSDGSTTMQVYAYVITPGGALNETVKLYGSGSGGTYMEMRYLGAVA